MDNNDILIRLRYALDLKNKEMVEIFKLGGLDFTALEMVAILTKTEEEESSENPNQIHCTDDMFDSFLNGLIIYKRGVQKPRPGQAEQPTVPPKTNENVNNLLLKKVKIALKLTTEDMLEVFKLADLTVTKGELGALLRKEGHRHYRQCGNMFARNFLRGLAIKQRQ